MPTDLVTLAQAAGELPELTVGESLTALSVMSAFGGSLLVYSIWAARWHRGKPVIDAAVRRPHYVPLLLLLLGGLFMGWIIVVSLTVGQEQATRMVELSRGEEPAESTATDPVGPPNDETSNDVADVADQDNTESDSTTVADPRQQLLVMMGDLLTFDLLMLLLFGGVVYATRRSRQLMSVNNLYWDDGAERAPASADGSGDTHVSAVAAVTPESGDDFSGDDLSEPDSTRPGILANPYIAPEPSTEASTQMSPQLPVAGGDQAPEALLPLERWQAGTEIRIALEAFLVAYLPTVLLRAALVSQQQDPQKHPLLEVLENGFDLPVMSLVFTLAVVAAPIVEELIFRVVLCGGMIQRRLMWVGIVVSSVMFSLSHGYPDSVALLPLALTLGFVYARRRSYRTVILVHFFFNLFNMGIAMLQQIGS